MTESEFLSSSSCPHCSATSQQSRELDVVVIQVDPLDAAQSCVAEESLQVVAHPRLAIGQGREGQRGVIARPCLLADRWLKWVLDFDAVVQLAAVEVFGKDSDAASTFGSRDN